MHDPSFKQAKQSLNQKKNKANILSFWTELFDYLHVLVDTIINLFTGYEGDNKFIVPRDSDYFKHEFKNHLKDFLKS